MGIIEKSVQHLEEMVRSLTKEFINKKIDKDFKSGDEAVVAFKTDKDKVSEIAVRLLTGKRDHTGDVVDELWIKRGGKKVYVRRAFVKKDGIDANRKDFQKSGWKEFEKVKKYAPTDYIKLLEKEGFWFPKEKLDSEKAVGKMLEEAATRLVEIDSIPKDPKWDADKSKSSKDKKKNKDEGVNDPYAAPKPGKGKDKGKGKGKGGAGSEDESGGGSGITLSNVAKKLAITAATTVLVAAATPVGGTIVAGGIKAVQSADAAAKLGNAAVQSVKAAARPMELVQKVAKEAVSQAGKKVLPGGN